MSAEDALRHLTRQSDDPTSGWLTPDRIRAAVAQVYDDLARAVVPVTTVVRDVVVAPPVGRSSRSILLPRIIPGDGWVTVEHGMNSEDVIVQASAYGLVVPLDIRIVGPDSVAVRSNTEVHQPVKIVVIR